MEKNPQIREGIISQIQKRGGNRKNGFAAPHIDSIIEKGIGMISLPGFVHLWWAKMVTLPLC